MRGRAPGLGKRQIRRRYGPVHAHQRSKTVGSKRGDERHVRPAVQGRGLVDPLPAFGAGVAPAMGQVGARLVHEPETGDVLGLQGFKKGRPQGPLYYSPKTGQFSGAC